MVLIEFVSGQTFISRRQREDDRLRHGRSVVGRGRPFSSHRPRSNRSVRFKLRQEVACKLKRQKHFHTFLGPIVDLF